LHGTDQEGSDLDLLIDPTPETTLFDLARIKGTLESLLGVRVSAPASLPTVAGHAGQGFGTAELVVGFLASRAVV